MDKSVLGTQTVTQVGLLVHDIEKSSKDWAEFLGVEPPPISLSGTHEEWETMYMDKPSEARAKLAFFNIGPGLQLELIEPDKDPNSTWRADLEKNGEGFHHLAFDIKGMKKMITKLGEGGMPLLQNGEYPGGRYAYVDANDKLKIVLELLEND